MTSGGESRPSPGPGEDGEDTSSHEGSASAGIRRAGALAWAALGVLLLVAIGGWLAGQLALVVVPVLLALFPATLLVPVGNWLEEHGLPPALAAFVSILGGILLIGLVVGVMVPLVAAELPGLARSASEGIEELDEFLADGPFGLEIGGLSELLDMAQQQLGEAGDLAGQALGAAVAALEVLAGLLLMLVVLFFYIKDGRRLSEGVISLVSAPQRRRARAMADRAWETLAAYFRGQLLVALVDAVFIGIGLVVLGVPLALPLAVLIFFGGLFPIVGAVTTGALAVLVALADQGLVTGLIVLGLVLAVQQLESNVLEPFILGRVIQLHPLIIVVAIMAGALTLGIFGAFIAVPVAAIAARIVAYLRGEEEGDAPASATT